MKIKVTCCYCGESIEKEKCDVSRAEKHGNLLFCDRVCFGLNRRSFKSEEQLKREKAIYDSQYRDKNRIMLKAKKAAYFKKDYEQNPEKYKEIRRNKQQKHNEYCRRPEYKAYKKQYDREYRAKLKYGDLWQSFILVQDIENQYDNFEVKLQKGLLNKSQIRRRNYEKLKREKLKRNTLGNPK